MVTRDSQIHNFFRHRLLISVLSLCLLLSKTLIYSSISLDSKAMDGVVVKQELAEYGGGVAPAVKQDCGGTVAQYIELSSSDSDYGDTDDSDDELDFDRSGKKARVLNGGNGGSNKKQKLNMVLPLGFLDPLPREQTPLPLLSPSPVSQALPSPCPVSQALPSPGMQSLTSSVGKGSKQFWKAGDYDDSPSKSSSTVGMDHVRVHPKFLHSNATSHKWALGAFAELLDNSLDEVCYGATFVNIDMMYNKKDGSRMLLIEDNGGGMDPDKMRQCMSLGYSAKSKLANVIGQYGNGFKTSTMRLGADVIVFSRCRGKDSMSPTQSIGMLSYTFLKSTGKEDIVVPMLDYEKEDQGWKKLVRSSSGDWNRNAETIVQWSPYSSEAELFHQFNQMSDHGTRIIIYNLWEDDQGELELDFCANQHDIQIRGVNRDEKKIEMARQFPNSRHFLTYRHSLRSYASILYLRLPPGFRIVLRGKDVEHHNIVNDMMLTQEVTYRPTGADGVPKDPNMVAIVRIGFVKDAKDHIDVQGFNVYHKNRLIKPFWRVWNAAGSDGRGVIGVLEANFVEPAHDKQGFERTTVLQRLESRLIQMQKTYWSSNCHKIGYAPRRHKKLVNGLGSKESSPEHTPDKASACSNKSTASNIEPKHVDGKHSTKVGNKYSTSEKTSSFADEDRECEIQNTHSRRVSNNNASAPKSLPSTNPHYNQPSSRNSDYSEARDHASNGKTDRVLTRAQLKAVDGSRNGDAHPLIVSALAVASLEVDHHARDRVKKMEESFKRDMEIEREKTRSLEAMLKDRGSSSSEAFSLSQLRMENDELRKKEESLTRKLQLETDRCKSLEAQLKAAEEKIEELNKEQEALINIFAEERDRREDEESNLRRKLKDASMTIQHLVDKVMLLEKMKKSTNFKPEKP